MQTHLRPLQGISLTNLSIGSLCQTLAYGMVIPAGPFPLMCIAFTIAGFGISLQNAHCNGFVASSGGNIATKIGFLHASYGTYICTCLPSTGVFRKQCRRVHLRARRDKKASELSSLLWYQLNSPPRSTGHSITWSLRDSLSLIARPFGGPSAGGDRKVSTPNPNRAMTMR